MNRHQAQTRVMQLIGALKLSLKARWLREAYSCRGHAISHKNHSVLDNKQAIKLLYQPTVVSVTLDPTAAPS